MKYTFIGTGSCVPNENRLSSGGILEIAGKLILIDCGTGILHNIPKAGYDYCDIDMICITHLHLDHINDFAALLFAFRNDPDCKRKEDLFVVGPDGFEDFYNKMKDAYGKSIRIENFDIKIREVKKSEFEFAGIAISTEKTFHTDESIGYRFEFNEKTFCASGDTGYHENVIKLCKNADLAVLECSLPEEKCIDIHLNPKTAGQIAESAGVKKLLLTHLYPVMENYPIVKKCKKYFSGDIQVAENFRKYVF
ncbi:MAG: ribonuclease Z [Candidatus Cloacimonadota bacterium]|nr:ribonuclease Z [Candidatus Cloacimonadota bacterium]